MCYSIITFRRVRMHIHGHIYSDVFNLKIGVLSHIDKQNQDKDALAKVNHHLNNHLYCAHNCL